MRDDTVRHQIRYLRECIKVDEALALTAADGWPEPTDKTIGALRAGGFMDEQISLIFRSGPARANAYADALQRIVDQMETLSSVRRPAHKEAIRRGIHTLLHLYRDRPGWEPRWGPDFPYARLNMVIKEQAGKVLADAERRAAEESAE
ncbi:DUF6221 family protein [Streptomyces sp. NPDC001982]|uniref:DUF6221 family protein n=1 Tax=Streptomyces sp. NPDC001982 TaxID=3154405 RepID=UPI00332BE691